MCYKKKDLCDGEVAEWLKAHAWKACKRETVSRVRIPLSPPLQKRLILHTLTQILARKISSI